MKKHQEFIALFTKNNRLPVGVRLLTQRKEGIALPKGFKIEKRQSTQSWKKLADKEQDMRFWKLVNLD